MVMYTDGGCYNNGERKGDGSYGFLILPNNNNKIKYVDIKCEYIQNTTNNRTEMMAIIEGLKYLNNIHNEYINIDVITDSGYVYKGYTEYLDMWVQNGWRTISHDPVKNKDLWLELQKLSWHIGFNLKHIKGHNKDSNTLHAFYNDIVDQACSYTLKLAQSGFIFNLRYFFDSKIFKIMSTELIERSN